MGEDRSIDEGAPRARTDARNDRVEAVMKKCVAVLASSYVEYREFCHHFLLTSRQAYYISRPHQLMGARFTAYARVGRWYQCDAELIAAFDRHELAYGPKRDECAPAKRHPLDRWKDEPYGSM